MLTYEQHITNAAKEVEKQQYGTVSKASTFSMARIKCRIRDGLKGLPIIFLEEGAMPEVGDLVRQKGCYHADYVFKITHDGKGFEFKKGGGWNFFSSIDEIIQRQGKQVITVKGESDE